MTLSLLRRLHRWIGLAVALPVALQGLTGAVLALADAIPPAPVLHVSAAAAPSAAAIAEAARRHVGETARVTRYTPAAAPTQPALVQLASANAAAVTVRVDPGSLAVLDVAAADAGVLATLRALHVHFLAAQYGGRAIGGWFGIALVALLITGIPIWWPRAGAWRAGFTVPLQARGVRLHRRLHGAVGIWTVLILFVLAGTGVVLAFPRTSRFLLGLEAVGGPGRAMRLPPGPAGPTPDLDRLIAAAQQAAPDTRLRGVFLPSRPGEAARVFLLHPDGDGATGSVVVQLDPRTLRVVALQDARRQPAPDRAYRWMHDLHEGSGLGPLWRGLTVLAGLALPLFAITGPLMWWLRRRMRGRLDRPSAVALQPGD